MLQWSSLFLIVMGLSASGLSAHADDRSPRVIALKLYADWCSSCQVLDPKVDRITPEFATKGVVFLRFDLTDEATSTQADYLAEITGLASIYSEHRGRTGDMLLLDAENHQELGRITRTMSTDEIREAINQALNSSN